jgi:GTPase SAR1 family protein
MNEFIDFKPQDAQLTSYIRFSITKKAFGKMSPNVSTAIGMLTSLSASRVLLITRGRDEGLFEVYTNDGTYLCTPSDDNNALLIIGYYKNSLMKQNYAMKNGICFKILAGIIVQIKLTQPYELYFDIKNGNRFGDNVCSHINVGSAISIIRENMVAKNNEQGELEEDQEEDEEYQPEKKLLNLLQLAESYSILSSEIEEKKAKMLGNIPYTWITSAEYDRLDRVAYQFGVVEVDESIFKVGVQVELEDRNQEKHAAEIIELVKEDSDSPITAIVLLFNKHIDISDFNQVGWFNLSYSTVNKDVQLAANEKIKTGEAPAKYMDVVFGKNSSSGFDNKDLTQLKSKLLEKKYPPNESQMNAIFSAINSKDVFLVMGPPGTGKTTVILEWVKYFVTQERKRVLVSSQNNKAVDNVLARIADEKDIDIIRIGSESKLQSEVVPYMFENKVATLRKSIIENSDNKLTEIDRIREKWDVYIEEAQKAVGRHEKEKESREQFQKAVIEEFRPIYIETAALLKEYRNTSNQRKDHGNKITSMHGEIEKYEKELKGIAKLFSFFRYRRNKKESKKSQMNTLSYQKMRLLLLINTVHLGIHMRRNINYLEM